MAFPDFFAEVPALRLHDGLAQLLGASDDGVIEYHYADAVRLAGHSCPTVAGGWLSARAALRHLYDDGLPERGGVSVYLDGPEDAGVTGVIAQVLTLVTGAAADNGFKGLGGRHARNELLHYASEGIAGIRFRRDDTGRTVEVQFDASTVPPDPMQRMLIQSILAGQADDAQKREFGRLWQDRVRRLLLLHADDPAVVQVHAVN
ncbi:MAG TPA: FmdE family protein [Rhodanobacteraceae bacterium]|jgi:formylmethanofuran dehydrogenase subunit E|nr:FmdE family protein [Rhodanobacteraceae bacterium]